MTLLLDTDVLIDLALGREPHSAPAGALLDRLERQPGLAFVAWHSLSNFYYLVTPSRGKDATKTFLVDLMKFVRVAPTSTQSFLTATRLELPDFEDAMQVAAALACGADWIVTRNHRHYRRSPIPARSPAEALSELMGQP
jgi:predicted nucleic acid-binding protein